MPRRAFRPPEVTATDRQRSVYTRGTGVGDGHRRATAAGAFAHIRNGLISFVARAKESKWNTPARSFVIARKLAKKPFSERDRADIDDEEHDLRVRHRWRDLGSELQCAV
jgi:hypothetical protein